MARVGLKSGSGVGRDNAEAANWAVAELSKCIAALGHEIVRDESDGTDYLIELENSSGAQSETPDRIARETFSLERLQDQLLGAKISAAGERGLVYGVLDLADRIKCAANLEEALISFTQGEYRPANSHRGVCRHFLNKKLDSRWFYDKDFWDGYLTHLATSRFNRFSLGFGMSYDFGHDEGVTDNYLSFVYPFFLDVDGFAVSAKGVGSDERAANLAQLKWIVEQTKLRGLHFQLSLWQHSPTFANSPDITHPIEGLGEEQWADYCGAALKKLLIECPGIDGLTFRIHYEGGVPDAIRNEFWGTVLKGVADCGRQLEIDIHSKGADEQTIETFLSANLPLTVSTKFAAEHFSLPYHAASIRERERAPVQVSDVMSVTRGARNFTRYSYGDFLRRSRQYSVIHRIWHGTQRFLLWADPEFASAASRAGSICGTQGIELFEPLSLRARWGSGEQWPRTGYRDQSLEPEHDWQKYDYYYRTWGRMLFDPDSGVEQFDLWLKHTFGDDAEACGRAIASASRILPLVMSSHAPGAGNRDFWPELYHDVPMVEGDPTGFDKERMGDVSALDPELFSSVSDFVANAQSGNADARYSPLEVSDWLEALASDALDELSSVSGDRVANPALARLHADAVILANLGMFFANKFRSAVSYELFLKSGANEHLSRAVELGEAALASWNTVIETARPVYGDDLAFGEIPTLRGDWASRLARVERNLADLRSVLDTAGSADPDPSRQIILPASRGLDELPTIKARAPRKFVPGQPVRIQVEPENNAPDTEINLHYRRVNHSERYEVVPMVKNGSNFEADIPGEYTNSDFDLIYYFSIHERQRRWISPGLGPKLSRCPYYIIEADR